jgi:predicted DNA-binding transcriptional regulator YafY
MLQVFGRKGKIPSYLLFEPRLAKGTEHLSPLIHAIQARKLIRIEYGKFWKWETEHRILKPLALKEFKQRWYLLAYDEHDRFKVFGLDRIRELDTLMEKFRPKGAMDFESYFRNVIGIINDPKEPVETVILTFTEFKGRYIQSMPLHPTQAVLVNDGQILQISLRVKINYELISEILSHGDEVRVDAPERLREMVREKAGNVVQLKLS